jgi:hypothetical protein
MSDTNLSGVFVLQEVRERILADVWPKNFTRSINHGWFGGGALPPSSSDTNRVERVAFASDTSSASNRGTLWQARAGLAATGNLNFGWFAGGLAPSLSSTLDRISFPSDTSQASFRTSMVTTARSTATGNDNYGWFAGSGNNSSTTERITFSDDTITPSTRGTLTLGRRSLAATGNDNFGWFGGGSVLPVIHSTIDRIDFAADTATASVRGPLSLARNILAATGNSNFGWFGGGYSPSYYSTIDRIDFSDDTVTASVRGPLSLARFGLAATGNENFGWFGGGALPVPFPGDPYRSTIERINFSDDTGTASVRGPLGLGGRSNLAATSGSI